jgi:DNA-binding LytR/AlgR family response regulator
MTQYRTLLVEDNPADSSLLEQYAGQIPFLTIIGTFSESLPALAFLNANPVDLLVLDIHLPGLTGLELVRALPRLPALILTTNSLTDSLEAYELGVSDYLVKPFRFERFMRAVNRALPGPTAEPVPVSPATIYLKEGRESVQIVLTDIDRVEAFGGFCRVYIAGKMLLVSHTITEMTDRLTGLTAPRFMRVHRSHIVAIAKIGRYNNRELVVDGQRIPVGEAYRAALVAVLGPGSDANPAT